MGNGVWPSCPTSLSVSGRGDTVTPVGERAGVAVFGEPDPIDWGSSGLPLSTGEEGDVASNLILLPFTLFLRCRGLGFLGGVRGAPSRGLRLGLTPEDCVDSDVVV